MTRYTKMDVQVHYDHGVFPAVNVKVYTSPTPWQVMDAFKCSEEVAEQALQYAFESAQGQFWEDAEEIVKEIFGYARMYSAGRSGGWLVVEGLRDVELWDAIAVSKWHKLVKWCEEWIAHRTSWDSVREDIEANRWAEEGAEFYNFLERKDGTSVCIAEANRAAEQAYKDTLHKGDQ